MHIPDVHTGSSEALCLDGNGLCAVDTGRSSCGCESTTSATDDEEVALLNNRRHSCR